MQAPCTADPSAGLAAADFLRGLALQQAGQIAESVEAYADALRRAPDHPAALHNLGAAQLAAGNPAAAIATWQRAVQRHPGQVETIVALGHALLDADRVGEAAILLSTASRRHPAESRLLLLNGRALLALRQTGPAIGALLTALALDPGSAGAHDALANAFYAHGDYDAALAEAAEAFRLTPDHRHANTVSRALLALSRYEAALQFADHALALQPGYFPALANRTVALQGAGRFEDALAAGHQAVAAAPADGQGGAMARHNLAMIYLGLGRMTPAVWDLFEARTRLQGKPAWQSGPGRWAGEDIAGRTIVLRAEQGFGDTLQFIRYAPMVAARGARVILAVQTPLVRLLRGLAGVAAVVPAEQPLPPHDLVCPLLSLPRLFGTDLHSIPPVVPLAVTFEPWHGAAAGLRVGLVWAGNAAFTRDEARSLMPADLASLAGISGVQFYSLQRHEAGLASPPADLQLIDLMRGVQDFADTAARLAGLDLVIAVDTAVAHLAATMGKPVWLLSRCRGCWRWLHGRADSPWYPTLRIVRQDAPGDWTGAVARVRRDLTALAAQADGPPAAAATTGTTR
jgi:tetratricopeptide (TPR) repeat protein